MSLIFPHQKSCFFGWNFNEKKKKKFDEVSLFPSPNIDTSYWYRNVANFALVLLEHTWKYAILKLHLKLLKFHMNILKLHWCFKNVRKFRTFSKNKKQCNFNSFKCNLNNFKCNFNIVYFQVCSKRTSATFATFLYQ